MNKATSIGLALSLSIGILGSGSLSATEDENLIIHSGSEKGAYFTKFCPGLQKALRKSFFPHICESGGDSVNNVAAVYQNPRHVGFAQLDAALSLAGADIFISEDTGIKECMFMVTKAEGVKEMTDLVPRMVMGVAAGGSELSYELVKESINELDAMRKVETYGDAMETIRAVSEGKADAGFFVQFPDKSNEVFSYAKSIGLQYLPVVHRELLNDEIEGRKLYSPEVTDFIKGFDGEDYVTLCTELVTITGSAEMYGQTDDDMVDFKDITGILNRVRVPEEGRFAKMFTSLKSATEGMLKKYMEE